MLKVEKISKSYGSLRAVDELSFVVKDGEIFGLLGENGAGKTTTFRMIMGLLEPDQGTITLDDEEINYRTTDKIGFVTEERSLLSKLTVYEQLIFYGTLKGMREVDIEKEMDEWLEKFEISHYKNKKIKELSKGNQQKVQFISAVLHRPKLLILDEPFTGLDPINVSLLKKAIFELQSRGCSIIFSSHQMEYIESFCEKLVILVKGKAVLNDRLDHVKKEYGIRTVILRGEDLDIEKIRKIKGVENIESSANEMVVHIKDSTIVDNVFSEVRQSKISKFEAQEPTLNDIFIEKVGESHE